MAQTKGSKGKGPAQRPAPSDAQKLLKRIRTYHNSPTERKRQNIVKAIQLLFDSGEEIPPKLPTELAPSLGPQMTKLDNQISYYRTKLQREGLQASDKAKHRSALESAYTTARNYSDSHFLVSKYYPKYEFEETDDEEEEEEASDLESDKGGGSGNNAGGNGTNGGEGSNGGNGGGNGSGNGGGEEEEMLLDLSQEEEEQLQNGSKNANTLQTNKRSGMTRLMEKRDFAAAFVHRQWPHYPGNDTSMKKAANIAHQLHRDYLRLAYDLGESPTPIPRKPIDESSPREFQVYAQKLADIKTKKLSADDTMDVGEGSNSGKERERLSRLLQSARDRFNAWSHDNLSIQDLDENNPTLYRFIDDGHDEPHPGGEVPDVKLTLSQLSRLMKSLKDIRTALPSNEIVPYLPGPIESEGDAVAYRGHLLALRSTPGIYRLISISEQILHTRESLQKDQNIYDASNANKRVLHNIKLEDIDYKRSAIKRCRGIVGVAHRGLHTLNKPSAKRNHIRIGDCLIEVAWGEGDPPSSSFYARDGPLVTNAGAFNSWEIRTDWRAFRGEARADLEIYTFAKLYDGGLIAPDGGLKVAKSSRIRSIEAKLDNLQRQKSALVKYRERSPEYSDSNESGGDEGDEDDEGDDGDDE